MAEALLELEQILFSRKEALTSEEDRILNSWKQNAIRDFGIGAVGAFVATWLVTRRLNNLVRMNLTAVSHVPVRSIGFYYGFRRFDKCVHSEVEQILSQHGTRLQTGLAEIQAQQLIFWTQLKTHLTAYSGLQEVSKIFITLTLLAHRLEDVSITRKGLIVGIRCVTRRTWMFELSSVDQVALRNAHHAYLKLLAIAKK